MKIDFYIFRIYKKVNKMSDDEEGFSVFGAGKRLIVSSKIVKADDSKKIRISKTKKKIEYPIFDKLIEKAEKGYWRDLMLSFSKGQIPKIFTFIPGKIGDGGNCGTSILRYINNNTKTKCQVELDDVDIDKTYLKLKNFLMQKNFCSHEDIIVEEEKLEKMYTKVDYEVINSFKDLKKRRNQAISEYVERMIKTYKLNDKETGNLKSVIYNGVESNIFDDNCIEVVDGNIVGIERLRWNPDTRIFEINITRLPKMKKLKAKKKDYITNSLTIDDRSGRDDSRIIVSREKGINVNIIFDKILSKICEKAGN
jgi:hypothetical protein